MISPILALIGLQFWEASYSAGRRVGIIIENEDSGDHPLLSVTAVNAGGPAEAAGMMVGDILRSIAGEGLVNPIDYDRLANHFEDGKPVEFTVSREGRLLTFEIAPGMPTDWAPVLVNALVILLYLAMALLAVDRRPGSLPSRLLYWFFILLAAELALPTTGILIGEPLLAALSYSALYLILGLQFGAEFHLVSLIPKRPEWLIRHPWLVKVFYASGLFIGTLMTVTYVAGRFFDVDVMPWPYETFLGYLYAVWAMLWSASLVAILAVRALSYPGYRGRLQSTIVLAGLLPWTISIFVGQILFWMGRSLSIGAEGYLGTLSLAPFPISIFVMLRLEDAARVRVLRSLIEEVQNAGSIAKISRLISQKLNLAFYTKCNYVFFRERQESDFTSTHSFGSDSNLERIPNDYKILEIAGRKGDTLAYPEDILTPLPEIEKEWLEGLQASLIVPIVESEGQMMGLLILGQKRSEEPYTPDDLELLHSLARQIALAHENLALQLKIQQNERIERQVLERLEGREIILVKECSACGFCFDSSEEECPRDGAELALSLPVERLIDGHYRLEQVLGRGGAAVVYLATDVRLNRGVAIKVLALSLLDDVVAPRRFEREARVAAQLLHPNIVTTHDFGKTRHGMPYIVMEHLEGRTLRQMLRKVGPVDGATAAEWFAQILDGLAAAHSLGVVHRDLKPDNVFVVRDQLEGEEEGLKLLDFGLAKIPTQAPEEFTSPGTIMGTLSYMSPEQLQSREIDARADLYSVGVMAYEAVLGQRPFEGRSPAQVLTSILQGDFDFPDTPEAAPLKKVLERCFEQDPKKRYGSAADLRRELIPALEVCPRLGNVKSAA